MPTFRNSNSKRTTSYSNSWTTGRINNSGRVTGGRTGGTGRMSSSIGRNSGRGAGWTGGRTTGGISRTTNVATWSPKSPQFNPIRTECQARIGSYKNVYSQFSGSGKTVFSPSVANKWLRFCNNGTFVYKFSKPQFVRYFGQNCANLSSAACTKLFQQKFGQGVKAVSRGNNNCWLVAATQSVTASPFMNYNWS
jgi:hypothetical protein